MFAQPFFEIVISLGNPALAWGAKTVQQGRGFALEQRKSRPVKLFRELVLGHPRRAVMVTFLSTTQCGRVESPRYWV